MKVTYLIKILLTGEESWDKIARTLHISPLNPNRLSELKEDIERFRPVGSIVSVLYSIPSIKISFLTVSQKEEFMNAYISDSSTIVGEKQIAFDDWRTKAMINKKFGLGIYDAPITHWKFTARNVEVEADDYTHKEGYAYIYGCDNYSSLVYVLKRRYSNCEIRYELSCSDDDRLVVSGLTISEAKDFLRHVNPHENPLLNLVDIEFDERDEFAFPPKYSERYLPDIPNCVWPTETKTLKAGDVMTFDYKIDDSTIYPHVDIIKAADEWLDTDKMWDMFTKRYTDDPLPAGVAIVKEEKDMAECKLKDTHNNLKLYMVEDKPTYTPRGAVRGVAHKIEELPEAIRKVQFNEKKGFVTVVWTDGVVSFAKCGPNDIWDPEKGLAIAIMKRWFKSTTSMNKWIKNTVPYDTDPTSLFQVLRKAFGVKDDLSPEEKAYCDKDAEAVKESVESDRAEMLEKYESVKEG